VWIVVVLLLLAGGAVAAYLGLRDGEPTRTPEPPPTGGLAGSPHADPPQPGPESAEAGTTTAAEAGTVAPSPAAEAATAPDAEAATLPVVADDAAVEAVRTDAADAVRRDTAAGDGRAEAGPREAAADVVARPDAEAPADEASAVEAEAQRPDAEAAQPSVADVARVFLGVAARVPRCAEGEGPGEFQVSARVRGSDGRVRDVVVTTGFSDGARQCVENIVGGLSFPPFGDETASFEHTFAVTGEADAGTEDSGVPSTADIRHRLRRARTRALACLQSPEGSVELVVRIDGNTQQATLESVEGQVTADEEACLRGVVEATEVPAYPTVMTVPLRVR
jgi:hypothetical protein